MCRIWPSHLSSASPWSPLAILGAKANPVSGHVPRALLAAYMCLHIIVILLLHALHAGLLPLSEISIRALGLTPGLDHPSFHPQVYHRVESRYRTVVRVHG